MGTTAPIEYRAVGDVDSPRTAAGGLVDHRGDLSTAAEPARSAALVGATTLAIYLAAVDRVANDVMSAAAVALGMHADHFERYLDKDPTVMRANNYQRRTGAPRPAAEPDGHGRAHRLRQHHRAARRPGAGLQICDDAGCWHDVVASPGSFIVNVGDLLVEWSNDRWRSTLHHRVVPPSAFVGGPLRRRSVAWFQQPLRCPVVSNRPTSPFLESRTASHQPKSEHVTR